MKCSRHRHYFDTCSQPNDDIWSLFIPKKILDKLKLNIFISHVDINKSFDNEDQVVIPVVQVY